MEQLPKGRLKRLLSPKGAYFWWRQENLVRLVFASIMIDGKYASTPAGAR